MGKSDNHIRNAAIAIMSITLFYRVMGFVKNTILAYYFGTSPVVDAYVMVFSIGGILFGWMSGFNDKTIVLAVVNYLFCFYYF